MNLSLLNRKQLLLLFFFFRLFFNFNLQKYALWLFLDFKNKINNKKNYFILFYFLRLNFPLKLFSLCLNNLRNYKALILFEFDFFNIKLKSFNSLYFCNKLFYRTMYLNYENFYLRINFFLFFRYSKYIEYFRTFKYYEYLNRWNLFTFSIVYLIKVSIWI